MNCNQARELLGLLSAGRLSGREARDVRMHLAACDSCAAGLDAGHWVEILPALDETIEPSRDFSARFHARLEERPQPWWKRIGGWDWPWRLAMAGALASVIIAGIFLVRGLNPPQDRAPILNDFDVAENLPLLQDMAVVSNLDLLEDFDTIAELPSLMKEGAKN
jgi:hypothetical protein